MKKLALSAIIGASLMVTSSAFALTSMTDSNMKAATGQAGVSIAIDNVVIEQYTGSTTYTDTDGVFGGVNESGSVVISDKHVIKSFKALVSNEDFEIDFATAANFRNTDILSAGFGALDRTKVLGTWNKAAALSIDVGKCAVLTAGVNNNLDLILDGSNLESALEANAQPVLTAAVALGAAKLNPATTPLQLATAYATYEANKAAAIRNIVATNTVTDAGEAAIYLKAVVAPLAAAGTTTLPTDLDLPATAAVVGTVTGVVIGLPTLLISTTADSYTVGVAMTGAINDGQNFIKISKGASAMAILGGSVEIAAH